MCCREMVKKLTIDEVEPCIVLWLDAEQRHAVVPELTIITLTVREGVAPDLIAHLDAAGDDDRRVAPANHILGLSGRDRPALYGSGRCFVGAATVCKGNCCRNERGSVKPDISLCSLSCYAS